MPIDEDEDEDDATGHDDSPIGRGDHEMGDIPDGLSINCGGSEDGTWAADRSHLCGS